MKLGVLIMPLEAPPPFTFRYTVNNYTAMASVETTEVGTTLAPFNVGPCYFGGSRSYMCVCVCVCVYIYI
jgi:hypothetical protein